MGGLAETIGAETAALLFGAAGLACQLGWPLMRTRPAILTVQFGIGASYALHYACLEAWTGAGIACLGATQTCVALLAGDRPWAGRLGILFLPMVALVCVATWSGPCSLMAMTACSLVMLGRLQRDTVRLRLLLLAAAPFGISHDIMVDAVPALIGAVISAALAGLMLIRELRRRSNGPRRGRAVAGMVRTA